MGAVVVRIGLGRNSNQGDRQVSLNVKEPIPEKAGYPVWLNEVVGNNKLLGHRISMFVQGDQKGKQWFELSGPIRKTHPDGSYVMEPRRNEAGELIGDKGDVVASEDLAATQYTYVKDRNDKVVMGKFGTINVQNTKKDGTASQFTYLTVRLYTDSESYQMARELYASNNAKTPEDKKKYLDVLNEMKKTFGKVQNMFINDGSEYFKSMGLGFEIRVNDKTPSSSPAP
jgi:hypothetical protein